MIMEPQFQRFVKNEEAQNEAGFNLFIKLDRTLAQVSGVTIFGLVLYIQLLLCSRDSHLKQLLFLLNRCSVLQPPWADFVNP